MSKFTFGKKKPKRSYTNILSHYWSSIQHRLFPVLEEHVTEERLTPKLRQLVTVWVVVEIERYVVNPLGTWWLGRPMHNRRSLARAFVAKAVYDLPTTECLIDLLKCNRPLRRL